ncbi:MAG TPA: AmmeMemoRadiSam system protein B, partial [Rhodospirillales bacterium]|nr:AmmeMemoRadiSam system protein B [Rhodospirillales bacterium]
AEEVAEVLERLWGGPETLIVISSDLSHYLDDRTAREIDAATCRAIESLDPGAIGFDQACGRVPVNGLLALARRRGLDVATLDLRNSGDTAGDRRRVVGYGAWMFAEPGASQSARSLD